MANQANLILIFIDNVSLAPSFSCTKPADVVTTETICSGASYTWAANGTVYTTTQTGTTITNDGCTAN